MIDRYVLSVDKHQRPSMEKDAQGGWISYTDWQAFVTATDYKPLRLLYHEIERAKRRDAYEKSAALLFHV